MTDRARTRVSRIAATRSLQSGARALAFAFAVSLVVAGCKSKDGGTGGIARNDPLMGRIPPQNVPVPDRGTAGGKKTDPLMAPTGRLNEKQAGAGYTDDPARFKGGPYVPDAKGVPAALASRPRDGEELKIETPGTILQPVGGGGSANPNIGSEYAVAEGSIQQLRTYGLTNGNYRFERTADGGYAFYATIPVNGDGGNRGYSGLGRSPAEAAKQVLDQVRAERGK